MNNQTVNELNNRKLDHCFFCIYSIPTTIYFKEGDDFINPKTLLTFFGCNIQGKRRYISSCFLDDLSRPSDWYDFFLSFKDKSIDVILFALLPNIPIIKQSFTLAFPMSKYFFSYCDSLSKINRYFTVKYSSNTFTYIKNIFVSKTIDEYNIAYLDFKNKFYYSQFLIDLLDDDFIKAKDNYSFDFALRKHIFAFYFIKETIKKLTVISHAKPYFSSIDEFIELCVPIIQIIEKKNYCSKADWIDVINLIYDDNKDLIKCYL